MTENSSKFLTSAVKKSNQLESMQALSSKWDFLDESKFFGLESTAMQNNSTVKKGRPAMVKILRTISGAQIYLSNSIPILAIRIELEVNKDYQYVPPLLANRVSHMEGQFNFQDRQLTIVLLDPNRNGIDVGSGRIIDIALPHDVDLSVNNVYASLRGEETCEIPYIVDKHGPESKLMELDQNDPNPFMTSTAIRFRIGSAMSIKLLIYDINGGLIKTLLSKNLDAGEYTVTWDGTMEDGRDAESGVYLYKLYADANSMTRKMVLSR